MSVKANASRRQMTLPPQYVNESWTIRGAKSRETLMLLRLWYLLQRCGLSSWPCRQPAGCWRSLPRPLPQTPTLSRCLRATCKVSALQILVVPKANLYEKDSRETGTSAFCSTPERGERREGVVLNVDLVPRLVPQPQRCVANSITSLAKARRCGLPHRAREQHLISPQLF